MDEDKDEQVSFSDYFEWTRGERYSWMTEDEVREQLFEVYDTDSDQILSWAEGLEAFYLESSRKQQFYEAWEDINPNWEH